MKKFFSVTLSIIMVLGVLPIGSYFALPDIITPAEQTVDSAVNTVIDTVKDTTDTVIDTVKDTAQTVIEKSKTTTLVGSATAANATSGTTGDCTWTLNGYELTISGNGAMADYDYWNSPAPWGTYITKVTIGNGVTNIGEDAFFYCNGLTSMTIPSSVTSIGGAAFSGCTGLTSVVIPNSVTSIGGSAFWGCTGLTSITIPSSVTSIGYSAFYDCTGLTGVNITDLSAWCKIYFDWNYANPLCYAKHLYLNGKEITDLVIPSDVTSIDDYVFWGCTGLQSVTIPNSVTSIDWYAFCGCTGLTSITIPNSVTSIGNDAFNGCTGLKTAGPIGGGYDYEFGWTDKIPDYAFHGCSGLTSIIIPNSVTSIGNYAFSNCTGLTSITIPNSVTSIGRYAFSYCTGLKKIFYKGTETEWGRISKYSAEIPTSAKIYYNYDCDINGHKGLVDNSTCTSDYNYDFICSACEERITGTIKAHHRFNEEILEKATCTEDGLKYCTCTMCPHTEMQVIPATGHIYDNVCDTVCNVCKAERTVSHVYDNDCDTTCNVCGNTRTIKHQYKTVWSADGTYHWHECSVCFNKTDYEKHIFDNACDTTCNTCGYVRTVPPHQYKQTYSYDGTYHFIECSICKAKKDQATHLYSSDCDKFCNICNYERTPLANHTFETVTQKPATSTEDGYVLKHCTDCNETVKETLHYLKSDSWIKDATSHWKECANCDEKVNEEKHIFDNACDTTCNTCGYVRTVPPHQYKTKYSFDDTYHWYECSECGDKTEIATHTLNGDNECEYCGFGHYIPGDIDGKEGITSDDAIYLLHHTFEPEDYPVNQPVDFDGDGFVTSDDAIYLLHYTFEPEDYPLH